MGNPLPTSPTNADISIGEEHSGRDDILLGDDNAREGTSSNHLKESFLTDDPNFTNDHLTAADRLLISFYGNTIHDNNGYHMDGGIDDEKL
eukprot:4303219-Ditylum_brightwellii.AAC.1